jgi:opacity protein-like surface antigen
VVFAVFKEKIMRRVIAVIGFAGIFAVAGTAMAQFSAGSSEAGFTVGGAIPLTKTDLTDLGGKNETAVKSGVDFGGRYLYHTTPVWAFGGEVSYSAFGDKTHDLGGLAEIKESAGALDVQGIAKYTFAADKKTRPYLIGGIGYGSLKLKTQTKPVGGAAWADTGTTESRTNFDENFGGLALSMGAGFEHFLTDTLLLGIEGRWKYLGTKDTVNDPVLGATWDIKSNSSLLLTAGLSWKFGK